MTNAQKTWKVTSLGKDGVVGSIPIGSTINKALLEFSIPLIRVRECHLLRPIRSMSGAARITVTS